MSEHEPTVYLVGGVPRSGKSTVGRLVARALNIFPAETDHMRALFNIFPYLGIGYTSHSEIDKVIARFRPSLEEYISMVLADTTSLVMYGEVIDPRMAVKPAFSGHIRSCFMGIDDPEAAFERIRTHEKPEDWTTKESDQWLHTLLGRFAVRSQEIAETCQELDLPYYNTSSATDMRDAVDQAYTHLVNP